MLAAFVVVYLGASALASPNTAWRYTMPVFLPSLALTASAGGLFPRYAAAAGDRLSGNPHEFVGLYGDVPSGIRLGVFDDRPDDPVVTAPFGLQVQSAPGGYPGGVGLGPSEVFLAFDDHFQFVGSRINTVYGGLLSFGGEADPVETACQFVRTRGFEEYFETPFRQPLRQIVRG